MIMIMESDNATKQFWIGIAVKFLKKKREMCYWELECTEIQLFMYFEAFKLIDNNGEHILSI